MRLKIFVKLTDHTCACNDLTNFECEAHATGNGSYVNLQKTREITLGEFILGGFQPFGTTVRTVFSISGLGLDLFLNLFPILKTIYRNFAH